MLSMDNLKLLCELSKLHLSDAELSEYQKEMTDIINLMDNIGDSDLIPLICQMLFPFQNFVMTQSKLLTI